MIKSEVEYRITKEKLGKLERSLAAVEAASTGAEASDAELAQLAHRKLIGDLRAEIKEYEWLRAGDVSRIECATWDDVPQALIKARIARGLTVEQLAERLGWKVTRLRRYEENDYESATLAQMIEAATVLCVKLTGVVMLAEMKRIPSQAELAAAFEPQHA